MSDSALRHQATLLHACADQLETLAPDVADRLRLVLDHDPIGDVPTIALAGVPSTLSGVATVCDAFGLSPAADAIRALATTVEPLTDPAAWPAPTGRPISETPPDARDAEWDEEWDDEWDEERYAALLWVSDREADRDQVCASLLPQFGGIVVHGTVDDPDGGQFWKLETTRPIPTGVISFDGLVPTGSGVVHVRLLGVSAALAPRDADGLRDIAALHDLHDPTVLFAESASIADGLTGHHHDDLDGYDEHVVPVDPEMAGDELVARGLGSAADEQQTVELDLRRADGEPLTGDALDTVIDVAVSTLRPAGHVEAVDSRVEDYRTVVTLVATGAGDPQVPLTLVVGSWGGEIDFPGIGSVRARLQLPADHT